MRGGVNGDIGCTVLGRRGEGHRYRGGGSSLSWDEVCGGDYPMKSAGISRKLGGGAQETCCPDDMTSLACWNSVAVECQVVGLLYEDGLKGLIWLEDCRTWVAKMRNCVPRS